MEKLEKKEKNKHINEDCYRLTISDMGKKLLKNENKGTLKLSNGSDHLYMTYKIKHMDRRPKAIIGFTSNLKSATVLTHQTIEIEEDVVPFGLRPYFICPECNTICRVLYLPDDKDYCQFKCHKCQNIVYHSTRVNRHTCGGMFYYTERLLRLMNKREKIPRLFYRGKATKKHKAFIIEYLDLTKSIDKPVRDKAEAMMLGRANGTLTYEKELSQFI